MPALIGITCSSQISPDIRPRGYRLNQAYVRAIVYVGGTPFLIPPVEQTDVLRELFDALDGLLLPGGTDIDPSRYGEEPHPLLDVIDPPLDEAELRLALWAINEKKPVLGICRGQQTLNIAAGGTLYQHIPSDFPSSLAHRMEPRDAMAHEITITRDSRLADLVGTTVAQVNSMHHQAVRDLGRGFVAVAHSPDSVIEGIELPAHPFAVAVQFHPEELVPGHAASERLLRKFVEAASLKSRQQR